MVDKLAAETVTTTAAPPPPGLLELTTAMNARLLRQADASAQAEIRDLPPEAASLPQHVLAGLIHSVWKAAFAKAADAVMSAGSDAAATMLATSMAVVTEARREVELIDTSSTAGNMEEDGGTECPDDWPPAPGA